MVRFKVRQKPNMSYIIGSAATMGVLFLVGNSVMTSVGTIIGNITCDAVQLNDTCGVGAGVDYDAPLYTAFTFLGLNPTGGTWSTTGIIGILGLIAVASFVLGFVKVSFK